MSCCMSHAVSMAANCYTLVATQGNYQNVDHKQVLEAKGFKDQEFIGCGAYGIVFKVRSSEDQQMYAIKCVPEGDCGDEDRILRMVDHENIIKIYDMWIGCDENVGSKLDLNAEDGTDSPVHVTGADGSSQSEHTDQEEEDAVEMSLSELGITPVPAPADEPSGVGFSENNYVNSEANSSPTYNEAEESGPLQNTQPVCNQQKSEGRYAYMVLELCDYNLADLFDQRNFDWVMGKALFKDIVKGLDHLHSKSVIHDDIKPDNIFIKKPAKVGAVGDPRMAEEIIAKIGDLGNAHVVEDQDLFMMQLNNDMTALGFLAVCLLLRPKSIHQARIITKDIEARKCTEKSVEPWVVELIYKILTGCLSTKGILDYLDRHDDKTSSNSDETVESYFGIRRVSTEEDDPTDN